ncbi:putative LOC729966 homolog isoform 1-T1 [Discoglossus pictus]
MSWTKTLFSLLLFSTCVEGNTTSSTNIQSTIISTVATTSDNDTSTKARQPVTEADSKNTGSVKINSTSVSYNVSNSTPYTPSTGHTADTTTVFYNSSVKTNSTSVSYNVSNSTPYTPSTGHTADTTTVFYNTTSHPLNSTALPGEVQESKGLADNPGLVAVICIFVSILCITFVVVAIKFCQKSEPEFQKLDEVPMNGINEEAPFARYPPK